MEGVARTRIRTDLARAHLLHGEWLRREERQAEARDSLSRAHEMFATMGIEAFAERAASQLRATGGSVRRKAVPTSAPLTPHESQVARLARDGLSNVEIGARLFLSPRTVEWHLAHVFTKLGITSRRDLGRALTRSPG